MAKSSVTKNEIKETLKSVGIISVDNGGFNTKILNPEMIDPIILESQKMYGHNNQTVGQGQYPEGTYKIKWMDKYYFFGALMRQSTRTLTQNTTTKSTDFFILSALQSIALYGYDINYVVTSTPFSRYSVEEIESITNRLIGDHELVINEVVYQFNIADVIVVAEAQIASFYTKPDGIHRWIDLGSRTIGYASTYGDSSVGYFTLLESEDPSQSFSGTIEKGGISARKVLDRDESDLSSFTDEYVEDIYSHLSILWDDQDDVTAFGGGAMIPELVESLRNRYPNLTVDEDPVTLQVRAMLAFATDPETGFQIGDDHDNE